MGEIQKPRPSDLDYNTSDIEYDGDVGDMTSNYSLSPKKIRGNEMKPIPPYIPDDNKNKLEVIDTKYGRNDGKPNKSDLDCSDDEEPTDHEQKYNDTIQPINVSS